MINKKKDLDYVDILRKEIHNKSKGITVNGFFKTLNIAKKNRSDFLLSAILKQYMERYGETIILVRSNK